MSYVWLSFADEETGTSLGVIITHVTAADPLPPFVLAHPRFRACDDQHPETTPFTDQELIFFRAVTKTHQLGINPGGQVLGYILGRTPGPTWEDRLILKPEVYAIGHNITECVQEDVNHDDGDHGKFDLPPHQGPA